MNSGFVNGFSVNSAAYPNWVIRAVVTAVAVASFAVAPTRITYASALGDAAVSVTLTQTHTIQARATTTASASVDVQPTLIYAGNSVATATATGNGAVRRDVFASAGGDATATGLALTAQAIGTSNATMAATGVLAKAHIIFPGRALTPCTASGTAPGHVTRYPTVLSGYGEVIYARAESSVKRTGHSYFNHDGYGAGLGSAVGATDQSKTKLIVTNPSFATAQCEATSHAYVTYPARSTALGSALDGLSTANSRQAKFGAVVAASTATANATAIRQKMAQVSATSNATNYVITASANYKTRAAGQLAVSTAIPASAKRTAYSSSNSALGSASIVEANYAMQHFAQAEATSASIGESQALQIFSVVAVSDAVVSAAKPIPGTQHRATVAAQALSEAGMPAFLTNYAGHAQGNGVASLIQSLFGTQHRATVAATSGATANLPSSLVKYAAQGVASSGAVLLGSTYGTQHQAGCFALSTASGVSAVASMTWMADTAPAITVLVANTNGWINGSNSSYTQIIRAPIQMATALVGKAYAIANSDVRAPYDRLMVVPAEDRVMTVPAEDRTMVVTA